MVRSALFVGCVSFSCLLSGLTASQAQEGHRVLHARVAVAPPLTVRQRSWLDVGNVVAVGTGNSYLSANESLREPVYNNFAPDRFGQSTLPGRFDLAFSNENPRGPSSGGIFFDQVQ